MKALWAPFASGFLASVGLCVSGMTRPSKILAFLDVAGDWDPSLGFVMAGALLVDLVLFKLILKRPSPILGGIFHIRSGGGIDPSLAIGAVLFGLGWGISGYCPGPAVASIVTASKEITVFFIAMVAGMLIVDRLRSRESGAQESQVVGDQCA
jgi:uncharacterized membrane protein YedE/YeeE